MKEEKSEQKAKRSPEALRMTDDPLVRQPSRMEGQTLSPGDLQA
jgi:hypothetical protein